MTKKKIDWRIVCTGIICLTILELYALNQNINGILLTGVVGVIAAAIGVTYQKVKGGR